MLRDLTNLQRDQILPLGNDDRCIAFLADITQRNGIVRRVCDDQRGARNRGNHAPASAVAGDGTQPGAE